jgi:hypothetical protein
MPEHDLVDVRGNDPGIGERLGGDPHDQALDALALEAPEGGVSPANDASGHGDLLSSLNVISPHCRGTRKAGDGPNLPNFGRFLPPSTTLPGISVSILALFAFAFHPRWA